MFVEKSLAYFTQKEIKDAQKAFRLALNATVIIQVIYQRGLSPRQHFKHCFRFQQTFFVLGFGY
jgi:hypothetical protein